MMILANLQLFGTPFGRYHYLRMPMGASLSSDVYQYKVDAHLEKISNCMAIADDIIMYRYRNDGSDHDKTGQRSTWTKQRQWV